MSKMHLRHPGFTYSPCRNKEELENLKEQEIQDISTEMS